MGAYGSARFEEIGRTCNASFLVPLAHAEDPETWMASRQVVSSLNDQVERNE